MAPWAGRGAINLYFNHTTKRLELKLYKPILAVDPMKKIIFVIAIAVIGLLLFFNKEEASKVCFDEMCFVVEVVDTPQEREKGLMFREELDKNKGMLFIFEEEGNYPFWMKNTLIPLDMIWISQSGDVVHVVYNSQPCKADPCPLIETNGTAKYVLEINGGLASKYGIEAGQKAEFAIIEP